MNLDALRSRRIPLAWPCEGRLELQPLEARLLLAGVAPVFGTPLTDQYFTSTGALTIAIDGLDDDGDALTITVESDSPGLTCFVPSGNQFARLHFVESDGVTPMGDVVVELFETRGAAATERFIILSTELMGASPFYTDVVVHRVIPGFMMQTGDKTNGDGTGGSPLGTFDDDFDPDLGFTSAGVLAMANNGPNTNDCQFFITDAPAEWLNQVHMIFGQVVSGQDLVKTITLLDKDPTNDRPYDPPLLDYVEVFENTQDATVTFNTTGGWAGEAQVTITLDDGNGNQTSETITVNALGDRPEIADPGYVTVPPGQTSNFVVEITDDGGQPMILDVIADPVEVIATIDSATGEVDITVPADYSGLIQLTVTAVENAPVPLEPTAGDIYVIAQQADDPPAVGRIPIQPGGVALSTDKVGDVMYVASMNLQLEVYDAADPADPVLLGSHELQDSARAVSVIGDAAFVSNTWVGLVSVDVSDPANMSTLDVEPVGGSVAVSHCIDGDIAYVASWGAGLFSFDISDPTDIVALDGVQDFGGGLAMSQAVEVVRHDDYAYVTDMGGGMFIIDVSDPERMRLASAVWVGGSPWGIDIEGDRLYVTDQANGMLVYDLRSPTRPKVLGGLALSGAWQVNVENQIALVSLNQGFAIVDVSDPENMDLEYVFEGPVGSATPKVYGTQIAMAFGGAGTILFDGTDLIHRTRVHKKMTWSDDAGVDVTISVRGCTATAYTTGAGTGDIETLEIVPESDRASVKISARYGETTVGDVVIRGTVKSLTGKGVDLGGDLTVEGTIGKLTLGDIADAHTITIGPRPAEDTRTAVTMKLGSVTDTSIISETPIKSITAIEWLDEDGTPDEIQAPWLGKLKIKGDRRAGIPGDFQAGLDLDGTGATRATLGSVKIAGDLSDVLWDITGDMGRLTVKGTAQDSTVRASGNMAGITLGASHGNDFLAGIVQGAGRYADSYADFSTLATIKSVKIKGLKIPRDQVPPRYFTDTNLSAASFGSVSLLNAEFDNGGDPFGIFAMADGSGREIRSVKYKDNVSGERWKWSSRDSVLYVQQDMTIVCYEAQPAVSYTVADLGGGMYGVTFVVRGNDGETASFFADMAFEGVSGGEIIQEDVHLATEIEVDDEDFADIFDGLGTPPYEKTRDSYFLNPFGTGDVQDLVKDTNFYQIKSGTGQSSQLEEGDLAYIYTSGSVHFYGSISRLGATYPIDGTVVI